MIDLSLCFSQDDDNLYLTYQSKSNKWFISNDIGEVMDVNQTELFAALQTLFYNNY